MLSVSLSHEWLDIKSSFFENNFHRKFHRGLAYTPNMYIICSLWLCCDKRCLLWKTFSSQTALPKIPIIRPHMDDNQKEWSSVSRAVTAKVNLATHFAESKAKIRKGAVGTIYGSSKNAQNLYHNNLLFRCALLTLAKASTSHVL